MARPTKCTPKITKAVAERIAENLLSPAKAALLEGVAETTFYRWMQWGDLPDDSDVLADVTPLTRRRYREFREAVVRARVQREAGLLAVAVQRARGFVTPAVRVKRWSKAKGEVEEVEVGGKYVPPSDAMIMFLLKALDPDTYGATPGTKVTAKQGEDGNLEVSVEVYDFRGYTAEQIAALADAGVDTDTDAAWGDDEDLEADLEGT